MENNYQNILFPYAYNILGSAEDARDAVQEVMYKYISSEKKEVNNECAYLVKGVINQSINLKKRKQKVVSDDTWLPEPVATENTESKMEREEILSYSMLVLLEKLNPKERAVFILKEAFDYSHKDIAQAFDCSIENARALLSRAKKKLAGHGPGENVSRPLSMDALLKKYIRTIQSGNLQNLEMMLTKDIAMKADGGTKVRVLKEEAYGQSEVARLLCQVYHKYQTEQKAKIAYINHQPALLFFEGDMLSSCQVFDIEGDQIKSIYSIVDPDKLSTLL